MLRFEVQWLCVSVFVRRMLDRLGEQGAGLTMPSLLKDDLFFVGFAVFWSLLGRIVT